MPERDIGDIIKDLTKQAIRIVVVWFLGSQVFSPYLKNVEVIPGLTTDKVVSGIILLVLIVMIWEILADVKVLVRYFINKSVLGPYKEIAEGVSFVVVALLIYFVLASIATNISGALTAIATIVFVVWIVAYIYKLGRTKEGTLDKVMK